MSEAKFTKGPWTLDPGLPKVIMADGETIAQTFYVYGDRERHFPQSEANANLIASAPELYEALELISNCEGLQSWGAGASYELKVVRAALAKAGVRS